MAYRSDVRLCTAIERIRKFNNQGVAQLGLERLLRKQEAGGSNPLALTIFAGVSLVWFKAPVWGTGEHWFKSSRPDYLYND